MKRLIISIVAIALFVLSIVAAVLLYPSSNKSANDLSTAITRFEKIFKTKGAITVSNNYLPTEYLYIRIGQGGGELHTITSDTTFVFPYRNIEGNNNVKVLVADSAARELFRTTHKKYNLSNLEAISAYRDSVNTYKKSHADTFTAEDEQLSLLYNAIAGTDNQFAYIAIENFKPVLRQASSLPNMVVNTRRFTELMSNPQIFTAGNAYEFLVNEKALQDKHIAYGHVNYRTSTLHIDDKQNQRSDLGPVYQAYFDSVCHRPFYALDTVNIAIVDITKKLDNQTPTSDNVWCHVNAAKLQEAHLVQNSSSNAWWMMFIGLALGTLVLYLLYMFLPQKEHVREEIVYGDELSKRLVALTDKQTWHSKEVLDLIAKELPQTKESIEKHNKQREEYRKRVAKEAKHETVKDYLNSSEYQKQIKSERQSAINDFKRTAEYLALQADADNYQKLIKTSSESRLIAQLEDIHKHNSSFPLVTTPERLFEKAKQKVRDESNGNQLSAAKVITYILNDVNRDLSRQFTEIDSQRRLYAKTRNMFAGIGESEDLPAFLDKKLSQLTSLTNPNIADLITFIRIFKEDENHNFSRLLSVSDNFNNILRHYQAADKAVNELADTIEPYMQNDNLNYLERYAVLAASLDRIALPVLAAWDKQPAFGKNAQTIINTFKADILQLLSARFFLSELQSESGSFESFTGAFLQGGEVDRTLSAFNTQISNNKMLAISLADDSGSKARIDTLAMAIKNIKSNKRFVDLMWQQYVKEFTEKTHSNQDMAWFYQFMVNIALRTVDYIDYLKHDRIIDYYYNYYYMLSGNDAQKTNVEQFRPNDYRLSNKSSQQVYDWAQQIGIKHLEVIVEKFLIKY